MIRYLFRHPKFPLLVKSDFRVFGAYNPKKIEMMIAKGAFNNDTLYQIIDSNGEGWSLYMKTAVISPLCMEKRWNKPKIIKFFNHSLEKAGLPQRFVGRSLSSKRLERVILEIIEFEDALEDQA